MFYSILLSQSVHSSVGDGNIILMVSDDDVLGMEVREGVRSKAFTSSD